MRFSDLLIIFLRLKILLIISILNRFQSPKKPFEKTKILAESKFVKTNSEFENIKKNASSISKNSEDIMTRPLTSSCFFITRRENEEVTHPNKFGFGKKAFI